MSEPSDRSRLNTFAGLALPRMAERRDDEAWLAECRGSVASRRIVLDADGRALTNSSGTALYLVSAECIAELDERTAPILLGAVDGVAWLAYRAVRGDEDSLAERRVARWIDLRRAGLSFSAFDAGLFAYARALQHWQSRVAYCGSCGAPTRMISAGHRALCSNGACNLEHFPRTDPAVIVIVGWRDACLLGRQPGWGEGRYSTLAGFVEPGETLEDTVRREVMEEAGVQVGACDYHSSQPWPFPASLMLGFSARAENPAIQVGAELAEARWFEVDDIVRGLADRSLVLPPPLSVSHRLIEHWLRETAGLELSGLMHDEPWMARRG